MANCKYCGTEVTWVKEGRKNVPVEGDGAQHECESFKRARDSYRSLNPTDIDPEILKQYQDNMNAELARKKPDKKKY